MISRHALAVALLFGASIAPACANRDLFVVDLVNNPASLDPQVQWDPDSYFVYRNVFDNRGDQPVPGGRGRPTVVIASLVSAHCSPSAAKRDCVVGAYAGAQATEYKDICRTSGAPSRLCGAIK
jgi:hypothetical protein